MNEIAKNINSQLKTIYPEIYDSLSNFGQEIFKPQGILVQGAEAKKYASKHNATVGIATNENKTLHLDSIYKYINNINSNEIFPYAPSTGIPKLRNLWKEEIYRKNNLNKKTNISLPVVTSGITHGLSLVGDLFINPNDSLILPDQFWGNYNLTYKNRYNANIIKYKFFNDNNSFNSKEFEKTLKEEAKKSKKIITILNFPNNPTGYTPSEKEMLEIAEIIEKQAETGTNIITVLDDAYFSFFYENTSTQSIFAKLSGKHKNIIAIKLDGATKEYYAWGLRVGFITFGLDNKINQIDKVYKILEEKLYGSIRSSISNVSHLSQTLVYKAIQEQNNQNQLNKNYNILKERLEEVKKVLKKEEYKKSFKAYNYNSGYFLTLKLYNKNSEKLRKYLLEKYQTGIISLNESNIRIAFSSIDKKDIENLFDTINKAIQEQNNQNQLNKNYNILKKIF